MIDFITGLHNLLRWLVLLGGLAALVVVIRGLASGAEWGDTERRVSAFYVSALDLQVLVGLILYFTSDLVQGAMGNFGEAMGNDQLRFYLVEHPLMMVLAAVAAHVGVATARRAINDRASFVRATVGFLISAALVLYAIPWDRSLLPWA